MIFIPT